MDIVGKLLIDSDCLYGKTKQNEACNLLENAHFRCSDNPANVHFLIPSQLKYLLNS